MALKKRSAESVALGMMIDMPDPEACLIKGGADKLKRKPARVRRGMSREQWRKWCRKIERG